MADRAAVLTENLRGSSREHEALARDETPMHRKPLPRNAFRALAGIAETLRAAQMRFILLDFDGTLVRIRRRPQDVRPSKRLADILERLVALPETTVAILSGRDVRTLQTLVGVKGIRHIGMHGSEEPHKVTRLSEEARRALGSAKRMARRQLAEFAGIDIEDKGHGFTVHYRGADPPSVRGASRKLLAIVAPRRHTLHVLNGKKVWEVLPRQIPGKGSAMKRLLADCPSGSALLFVGDDEPDEPAFAALEEHITVHVGRKEDTRAHFCLRSPGEVLRFLEILERELR